MDLPEMENQLRRALSALHEIECALGDGDHDLGKRQAKFALDDVDDARDLILGCGARLGLTDLEGARV